MRTFPKNNLFLSAQVDMRFVISNLKQDYNTALLQYAGVNSSKLQKVLIRFKWILIAINVFATIILVLLNFIVYPFRCIHKKVDTSIFEGDTCVLYYHHLLGDRLKASELTVNNAIWCVDPHLFKERIHSGKNVIFAKNCLRINDWFRILRDSIDTVFQYVLHFDTLCLIHKVWEYYETYYTLKRICKEKTIAFCNQYDKWAFCFDSLPAKKKILIQHGILPSDRLPCRLNSIDEFYALSNHTWQDAYSNLLSCTPKLSIMKPSIELTPIDSEGRISVTIVSEITHFELEEKFLRQLNGLGMDVFVKKHPALKDDECYRKLQEELGFHYITDRIFPKTDFVISYFSTLAFEYMAWDIPVYMYEHDDEFDFAKVEEIMNDICAQKTTKTS